MNIFYIHRHYADHMIYKQPEQSECNYNACCSSIYEMSSLEIKIDMFEHVSISFSALVLGFLLMI